jgi:D-glycero-D-manno-heptose 1,7-bisphosphate phosphatase
MIGADGIWAEVLRPVAAVQHPRPALFLDRDGVIVEEVGFLRRAEDVRLIAGAAAAIAHANVRGIPVIVVSNQSGLGRGLFDCDDFVRVQQTMIAALARGGASLDAVFAAPHHPDAAPRFRHPDHPCRKPNPGMLLRAAAALRLDLAASWIIGDRATDMVAGCRAGLAGGLHVATGEGAHVHERAAARLVGRSGRFTVFLAATIAEAVGRVPLLR